MKLTVLNLRNGRLMPFEAGPFCLGSLVPLSSTAGSTSHNLFCKSLIKVAASHKLDHFHIFKLCVFQGVFSSGEEE